MPSDLIVIEANELQRLVHEAVREGISEALPSAIKEADKSEWLDPKQFEEEFSVSYRSQQHLRDTRQLPFHKINRKIRYKRSDIDDWVRKHHIPSEEAAERA